MDKTERFLIANMTRLRNQKRLTQSEMAEAIGVGLRTYQKYEYGNAYPRPDKVGKIAKALGVPESELFKDPNLRHDDVLILDRAERILLIHDKLKYLNDDQLEVISDTIDHLLNPIDLDQADTDIDVLKRLSK